MLNTRDLEERWLKYKIKSYIPHMIITISLLVISIVVSILFYSDNKEKNITLTPESKITKQIKNVQTVVTKTPVKTTLITETIQVKKMNTEEIPNAVAIVSQNKLSTSSEKSLKLSPSLDFMKKMQHSSLPYYQEEPVQRQQTVSQVVEEVQELEVEENIKIKKTEKAPPKISIKRREIGDDIRHIIKRFKKNNNPALSLFVAKKYYELGEYHKAYNYALITNQINRDIDASWIVFSKSLVKLNQKDMAIKTLKHYIEDSHSSGAQILLDEILSGKFK